MMAAVLVRADDSVPCGVGEDVCSCRVARMHVFCPRHRALLPDRLAIGLFRSYSPGQWARGPETSWFAALDSCVTYLRQLAGVPVVGADIGAALGGANHEPEGTGRDLAPTTRWGGGEPVGDDGEVMSRPDFMATIGAADAT